MDDMITKGEGNSRFLKSIANFMEMYPTYEDMAAALVAGTFKVDFNGLNPDGILQEGTALNKANLLSDATASALGGDVSTVDGAIMKVKNLINHVALNSLTVEYRQYEGTQESIKVLNFSHPVIFFIITRNISSRYSQIGLSTRNSTTVFNATADIGGSNSTNAYLCAFSNDNKTITLSGNNYYNSSGYTYYIIAIEENT